jgi:hypothetical protein
MSCKYVPRDLEARFNRLESSRYLYLHPHNVSWC